MLTKILSVIKLICEYFLVAVLLFSIYLVLEFKGNIHLLFVLMTALVVYSNVKITKYYRNELDEAHSRYFELSNHAYKMLNKNFQLLTEIANLKKCIPDKPKCINADCNGIAIPFRSINKKRCETCNTEWDWDLDPGQKSPVIDGLSYDTAIKDKEELKQIGCTFYGMESDDRDG